MRKPSPSVSRRALIQRVGAVAASTLPAFHIGRAWAQGRSINVGTYKGVQAEYIRQHIIPKFESDYQCRVFQTEGSTLGQIALLRIQKAKPTFSVMFMDDVGVPIAREEGLIDPLPLAKMANSAKVSKRFVVNEDHGIAFCVSTAAPFINTDSVKPLASYADLWSDAYRNEFMMVTAKQTQGVLLPVVAAALATGLPIAKAQYEIGRAWDKLAAFKPNVQTVYEAGVTSVLQVSQGQAKAGGLELSKVVLPYTAKGAPVDLAYPKEGVFGVLGCMTQVRNGPNPDLAAAFMDRMLDPAIQKGLAESSYAAPTVEGVTLTAQAAKLLPYPLNKLDAMNLAILDWAFINTKRGEIIERTNQIFGGRA